MDIVYCDNTTNSSRGWPTALDGKEIVSVMDIPKTNSPSGLWCIHRTDWQNGFCERYLKEAGVTSLIEQAKNGNVAVLWYSGGDLNDFNLSFGEKYPFTVPHGISSEHTFFQHIRDIVRSLSDKQEASLTKSLEKWIERIRPALPETLTAAYLLLVAQEKNIDVPLATLSDEQWKEACEQYKKISKDGEVNWSNAPSWGKDKIGEVRKQIGELFSRVASPI